MSLAPALARGLRGARVFRSRRAAQAKLLDYLALIDKWNRVYNLTAVREPEQDAGASPARQPGRRAAPARATRSLDVGSGAGLPGIPLALARPQTAR